MVENLTEHLIVPESPTIFWGGPDRSNAYIFWFSSLKIKIFWDFFLDIWKQKKKWHDGLRYIQCRKLINNYLLVEFLTEHFIVPYIVAGLPGSAIKYHTLPFGNTLSNKGVAKTLFYSCNFVVRVELWIIYP